MVFTTNSQNCSAKDAVQVLPPCFPPPSVPKQGRSPPPLRTDPRSLRGGRILRTQLRRRRAAAAPTRRFSKSYRCASRPRSSRGSLQQRREEKTRQGALLASPGVTVLLSKMKPPFLCSSLRASVTLAHPLEPSARTSQLCVASGA